MANWDDGWDDGNDYFEQGAPPYEALLFGDADTLDQHAQDLFIDAYIEKNDAAYVELVEYMWDQYGIDFEADYQWEDFREWYDAQ